MLFSACYGRGLNLFGCIPLATGEAQERRRYVAETFHRDPEGSTPSRQRRASQPEASLAWAVATPFVKRRQQMLKLRGGLEITQTPEPSSRELRGQHWQNR